MPRKIFQRYYQGQLQYKIPVDITFFSRVLKPDKLEGRFKDELLEIVLTINFEWTSFEP